MTEALRRAPRAVRVGSVLAMAAVLVVVAALFWNNQRLATQENFRLYDQCLSTADDVSQIRSCTRDFYVRRDGRPGGSDPVQLAVETSRLEQLRAAGAVEAAGPLADPRPDPTVDPTDPRPAPTAPPVAAVPVATPSPVAIEPQEPESESEAGEEAGEQGAPAPAPAVTSTTTAEDRPTAEEAPTTSRRPPAPPAQRPPTDHPTADPRPSRATAGAEDRERGLTTPR